MANTYIATPLESDERLAQFRSTDFDSLALAERFGSVAVFDLTDNLRPVAYITYDGDSVRTEWA
jgi:hypothetical protein